MSTDNPNSFDHSRPDFFNLLDSDWRKAGNAFAREAYLYLKRLNPPILSGLSPDLRDDVIQTIIIHFVEDKCRRLKKYEDIHRPFKYWFTSGAVRKAITYLRTLKPTEDSEDHVLSSKDNPSAEIGKGRFVEMVHKASETLSKKCQVMILAFYRGYNFHEIAEMLGIKGPEANKTASNDFKHCRKRLKQWFLEHGFDFKGLLESFEQDNPI